jgi:hypothetical protein
VDRADDIARRSAADTVVELGSGTSEETRILLTALAAPPLWWTDPAGDIGVSMAVSAEATDPADPVVRRTQRQAGRYVAVRRA